MAFMGSILPRFVGSVIQSFLIYYYLENFQILFFIDIVKEGFSLASEIFWLLRQKGYFVPKENMQTGESAPDRFSSMR